MQVITIDPVGGIKTLEPHRGGVDIKPLGRASVRRFSRIHWDEEEQGYFIEFCQGELTGRHFDEALLRAYPLALQVRFTIANGIFYFRRRQDAIDTEHQIYNSLALRGNGTLKD